MTFMNETLVNSYVYLIYGQEDKHIWSNHCFTHFVRLAFGLQQQLVKMDACYQLRRL